MDLVHFAKNLDTPESRALAEALLGAVKYNRTSSNMSNSYGLSIYFPYRKTSNVDKAVQTYKAIGMDSSYSQCIREFASMEVSGQVASGGSNNPYASLLGGGYSGTSSSSFDLTGLLGDYLSGGNFGSIPGLSSGNTGFLFGRSMSTEDTADYIAANHFDPSYLTWTQNADGEYLDAGRTRVFGVENMPIKAPVCMFLLGDATVLDWLDTKDGDVLVTYGERVTEGGRPVPDEVGEAVKKIVGEAICGAGYVNERGEHVIDLKGLPVGTHYTVNLLLGRRIGFEKPMLTTPKGSLDAFGRGAFRAGADTQVTASRFVMTPEEAGEPVNRQFYLFEDNRQIFYSANPHENVKSAICTHKPNHSVIEYETECGLKITRTIFIVPQYEGLPDATEAQKVEIENLTDRERNIKIVMTGMFGVMPPDALSNDIIYVSIIHESGTLCRDGKVYALAPNMRPRYAKPRRRFATVIADGEPMDEYAANYTDFIGRGTLEHPENAAHLPSRPIRKVAPFFAMAKTLKIPAGERRVISSFVGYLDDPVDSKAKLDRTFFNLFEKFSAPGAVDEALEDVKRFHRDFSSYLSIDTGDRDLDAYVNNNLPFQVLYQAFISACRRSASGSSR